MNKNDKATETAQNVKNGIKRFPYRKLIAMLLMLSLLFSIVAMPIQAAGVTYSEKTADEIFENSTEKESKTPDSIVNTGVVPAVKSVPLSSALSELRAADATDPDEIVNDIVNDIKKAIGEIEKAIDGITEDTVEEENQPSASIVSTEIVSVVRNTPYSSVRYELQDGELVMTSRRPLGSAPDADEEGDYIDWTLFDPSVIINDSLDDNCILGFELNHNSNECKLFTNKDGAQTAVYGIKNYSYLADDNLDFKCDTCGCCIDGCTDGEEQGYTAKDIESEDANFVYNSRGEKIGTKCSMEVTSKVTDSDGNVTDNSETINYIDFEMHKVTDPDGICDVCGKHYCETHDFSDGLCDVCGRCINGCTDGEGSNSCAVCGKCKGDCVDANTDGLCDVCGVCVSSCVDANINGTTDGTPDGLCDVCGKNICTSHDFHDGICDVCGHEIGDTSSCPHSDKFGSETCNSSDGSYSYCQHMDTRTLTAISYSLQSAYDYLKEQGIESDGFNARLEDLKKTVTYREEAAKLMENYAGMDMILEKVSSLSGNDLISYELIGSADSGNISYGSSYYGLYKTCFENCAEIINAYSSSTTPTAVNYEKYFTGDTCKYNSYAEKPQVFLDKASEVLDNSLAEILGEGYKNGKVTLSKDNLLTLKSLITGFDDTTAVFLYGAGYKTGVNDKASTAKSVYNGSQSLPSGTKDRQFTELAILDLVLNDIKAEQAKVFTSFETQTYRKADGTYAIREYMYGDIARAEGENYVVTDEKIQKCIGDLDAFVSSDECMALLLAMTDSFGGMDISDTDGDGKVDLYDLIMSILPSMILNDENLSKIIIELFSTVTDLLSDENIKKILTDPNGLDCTYKDGKYYLESNTVLRSGLELSDSPITTLLLKLGEDAEVYMYINGADGTKTIRSLITETLGLKIFPKDFAGVISKFNTNGKYDALIAMLNNCGDSWHNVSSVKFGIKTMNDVKEVIAILLASAEPLIKVAFSTSGTKHFDLGKLAEINCTKDLLGFVPVLIYLNANVKLDIDAMSLYENLVAPIFEALDIGDYSSENFAYTLSHISFTGNTKNDMLQVSNAIFDPLCAVVKQIAEHPVEKLSKILPNLMLYMGSGKLLELFDVDTSYAIKVYDMAPDFGDYLDSLLDYAKSKIFKHWYDWARPSKYLKFAAATVIITAFSAGLKVIDTIVGSDGFKLNNMMSLMKLNISSMTEIAGLKDEELIKTVIQSLPKYINVFLEPFGLQLDPEYKPDWPKGIPDIYTNGSLIKKLNLYEFMLDLLSTSAAIEALGFDINNPSSLVEFLVNNLCDMDGKHLFDTHSAQVIANALNVSKLQHLGELEKRSDSIRGSGYYTHSYGLSSGQYYFVKANTSDVFTHIIYVVAEIMSDEHTVKNILEVLGLNTDTINELLAKVDVLLKDNTNATLHYLLSDLVDEEGKLTLSSVCNNLSADQNGGEKLLCVVVELLLGDGEYNLIDMLYAEANEAIELRNNTAPYLEYDNKWNKELATILTNDADNMINALISMLGIDLDGATTIQEFASEMIGTLTSDPELLTIFTQLLSQLSSMIAENENIAALLAQVTELDLTGWANDFAYLFDDAAPAPDSESKKFANISAEKVEDGIKWLYNGEEITTREQLFGAIAELLMPLDTVFDLILNGKSMQVLPYTKDGVKHNLVTVKGTQGYNSALVPVLEAMLGDKASELMDPNSFAELGGSKGVMYLLNFICDYLQNDLCKSETLVGDLMQMLVQVMYALSENGMSVIAVNMLKPIWVLADTVRPIININVNDIADRFICALTYKLGKYDSPEAMLTVLEEKDARMDMRSLSMTKLLNTVSVVLSTPNESGVRVFFDADMIYAYVLSDLANFREQYTSLAYKTIKGALADEHATGYRLNIEKITGPDALTVLLSLGLEMFMFGDNAYALDGALGLGGLLCALKSLITDETVYTSNFDWAYLVDGDSAKQAMIDAINANGSIKVVDYRSPEDTEAFNKYLEAYEKTDWTEDKVIYLVSRLDDMITELLNLDLGNGPIIESLLDKELLNKQDGKYTVGSLINGILTKLFTDEFIDKLVYLFPMITDPDADLTELGEILKLIAPEKADETLAKLIEIKARSAELIPYIKEVLAAIGIDLSVYDIDKTKTIYTESKVIYFNRNGEPTGLERDLLSDDLSNLGAVLAEILTPFGDVVSFVLLGMPVEMFNKAYELEELEYYRYDTLITINGFKGYNYALLPLLETLGCKDLKPESAYIDGTEYSGALLLKDVLNSITGRILYLVSDSDSVSIMEKLLDLIPPLMYFINSNGMGVILQNLLSPIEGLVNVYNKAIALIPSDVISLPAFDLTAIKALLSDFSMGDMLRTVFAMVSFEEDGLIPNAVSSLLSSLLSMLEGNTPEEASAEGNHLVLNDFLYRVLDKFAVGEIYKNTDSVCPYDMYSMRYASVDDKAATVTILISVLLDFVEDPDNEAALRALLGSSIFDTVINIFNLYRFEFEMKDFDWLFTEYADSGKLVSAFDTTETFEGDPVYGDLWTPEKAKELAENSDQLIRDLLYLLGVEYKGMAIRDLPTLLHALASGILFNNEMMDKIAGVFGLVKPFLDEHDPDGSVAEFVKLFLDVDLHSWDDYAAGGKYANGRDWGFFDDDLTRAKIMQNSKLFEDCIVELLDPAAPLLAFILADRDYTFFIDGDGLGYNNDEIQLTLYGAEGYRYVVVPILEALHVNVKDIYSPEEYSKRAVQDNSYAVRGLVHPIMSKANDIMNCTAIELMDLLPSLIYFINSNGIGTTIENLLHSLYMIGAAVEPIKEVLPFMVYDEDGMFDLYNTLDINKIAKDIFGVFGISTEDFERIYNESGGNFEEIDGFEDIDFRLLMSIGIAFFDSLLAENGLNFVITPLAADLVNELSYGFIKSFDSLSGRRAYTMVLDKFMCPQCYGDFFTVLVRLGIKFLAQGENLDAIGSLLRTVCEIDDSDYEAAYILASCFTAYLVQPHPTEGVMLAIYYVIYGASTASGETVRNYVHLNAKWARLISGLPGDRESVLTAMILRDLIKLGGEEISDVIDTHEGVAPSGFVSFFKQVYNILTEPFIAAFRTLRAWFSQLPFFRMFY